MKHFFVRKEKGEIKSVLHRFIVILVFLLVVVLNLVRAEQPFSSFPFRLYLIPIVLAAYVGIKKISYLTALVAFVQGTVMTFRSGNIAPNILFLLISAGIFFFAIKVFVRFDERLRELSNSCKQRHETAKASYDSLLAQDENLLKSNRELDERGMQLAELYEGSKAMGASLDFEKILEIMREEISKTFEFTGGALFLKRQKKSKEIDFLYYLDSGKVAEGDIQKEKNEAVAWVAREAKPLMITQDTERRKFNLPQHLSTFLAEPFILSGKVIGIACLENFALRGVEKQKEGEARHVSTEEVRGIFSILTTQFALQMQKAMFYEEVEELSITDGLTQVALRRYFLQRFEEEVKRSRHHGLPLSFLMVDIDHFKNYNDRYGHLVGDAVLRQIAKTLGEGVREVDLIGRYGGEEFCIMLPETNKDSGYETAERIRSLVENSLFKAYDEETSVTISIGVSCFPEDADTGQELLDKADAALLRAKDSGRNRVCKCY